MLSTIRHRLAPDEGFTLVEVLVAMFVIGVALMALLTVFVTSARSVQDQRARSAATRVGTEQLESLRARGFAAMIPGGPVASTVTRDGRPYTVATTVVDQDVDPTNGIAADRIRRATVAVSWSDHGESRAETFTTAVAPPTGVAAVSGGEITALTATPGTVWVDGAGRSLQPVILAISLAGFTTATPVTLAWTDAGGQHTRTVTNNGSGWSTTIAVGEIVQPLPAGALSTDLTVTAYAGTAVRASTLVLEAPPANPPAFVSVSVAPNPIILGRAQGNHYRSCNSASPCVNTTVVDFEAEVSNLDASNDRVTVRIPLETDPNGREVVLTPETLLNGTIRWRGRLNAGTAPFDRPPSGGTHSPIFTFIASQAGSRVELQVTASVTMLP